VWVSAVGELVFIGLGLHNERDVSLRGLEEARGADTVFVELYTSLMPALSIQKLEALAVKEVTVVPRRELEDEGGQIVLDAAKRGKVAFLVPGDPLIATTHVDLRIHAKKLGIKTRIIHGASIISAVIGLSGLQNYKFGRSVTVPFSQEGFSPETPYDVIRQNGTMGLHTLCFLDIDAEEERYMRVREGLQTLLAIEERRRDHVITADMLVVGVARAGSETPIVKAGQLQNVMAYDFALPPHALVFPGRLHFMEAEALIALAEAPSEIRQMV
jgi:diphthine synthase